MNKLFVRRDSVFELQESGKENTPRNFRVECIALNVSLGIVTARWGLKSLYVYLDCSECRLVIVVAPTG